MVNAATATLCRGISVAFLFFGAWCFTLPWHDASAGGIIRSMCLGMLTGAFWEMANQRSPKQG
jgi:hypothetical protein